MSAMFSSRTGNTLGRSLQLLIGPFDRPGDPFRVSAAIVRLRFDLAWTLNESNLGLRRRSGPLGASDVYRRCSSSQDECLAQMRDMAVTATAPGSDLAALCRSARLALRTACRRQVQKLRLVRNVGEERGGES